MKYAAEIGRNGKVRRIVSFKNSDGIAWFRQNLPGKWVRTRRNGCAPNEYANVGDIYDKVTRTYSTPQDQHGESLPNDPAEVEQDPQYDAAELNDPANP